MNKYKLRMFVKNNTEVYEIINTEDDSLAKYYSYPLGTTFVDFIYSDFNKFTEEIERNKHILQNHNFEADTSNAEEFKFNNNTETYKHENSLINTIDSFNSTLNSLIDDNIFYFFYNKYIQDIAIQYNKNNILDIIRQISNENKIIIDLIRSVYLFISKCLYIDTDNKKSIPQKFELLYNNYKEYKIPKINMSLKASEYDFSPEQKYHSQSFSDTPNKLSQIIYPEKLEDIIYYLFIQQIQEGTRYNVCQNCGKLFVLTGYKNTEYCDRPVGKKGNTCKDIGASQKYRNKKRVDPIHSEYLKAYKTKNARIRYKIITKEEFNIWSENARKMRDKCYNGDISLEYLTDWLKSDAGFTGEFMSPKK